MQNLQHNFKGVWIPREIWLSDDISVVEKCLLVEIDSLDNDDGCIAGNEYFAKFFGVSTRQIRTYVSHLSEKKYITVEMIGSNRRRMRVAEGIFLLGGRKLPPTGGRKLPHNKLEENKLRVEKIDASENASGKKDSVNEFIDLFKPVNPNHSRLFANKNQRAAIQRMTKTLGEEKVRAIIEFLPKNNGSEFAPIITTPTQLEAKMGNLMAFWQQRKQKDSKIKIAII